MNSKLAKYHISILKKGLPLLFAIPVMISSVFLSSCNKTDTDHLLNYDDHSSQVGPEGGEIIFFRNLSNIPDHLFPSLDIPANTFSDVTQLKIQYIPLTADNLGNKFANYSNNIYAWSFSSSISELNKPITLTLPFDEPFPKLLLDHLKDNFQLYKTGFHTWDWEAVQNYNLDVNNNLVVTQINNFQYRYAILFKEIKRNDNFVISVSGDLNALHQFANADYFRVDEDNPAALGFHYNNISGNSEFTATGTSLNVDYELAFSISGNSTGIFKDNDITINYRNTKDNENWVHDFANTSQTTIVIFKYGDIGQTVEGKISGILKQVNSTKEATIEMNFKLIRTR